MMTMIMEVVMTRLVCVYVNTIRCSRVVMPLLSCCFKSAGSRVVGIISECSCLAPYRELFEELTSLPVFDWRYAITLYGQL